MCDCDCELPKRERWKLVKDEALREAAENIRRHKDEARGAVQATKVVDFCADLIDPDKDN